ncbi:TetR/AcrR family transcriptional regulator [Nocardia sp. NBC_00508]|uniref:TetR/AcrR family transcriptional regulator n=1 Tax=Nocardia sp. NBC_00508 TaxID=2975992 RepID=UPI002E81437F|nr:TetR/AcrR family transcriptional regulator [Nocardia sp. NBC_00508]WUD66149.1 TetR/AcrR family transcriptional regulator [Nocardia sp. NBC_00508]
MLLSTGITGMTGIASSRRSPGRPRSEQADEAILAAALELFLECGANLTSIEQVAQRAGVTRATVYRRFRDKTALLVQAISSAQADDARGLLDWPDLDHMLIDFADHLSDPRNRRLLRRLHGSVDDYPELLRSYRDTHDARRVTAVRTTLDRACHAGQLPSSTNLRILQQILNGAILHHLVAYPDNIGAEEIKAYLTEVLQQVGYRPGPSRPEL